MNRTKTTTIATVLLILAASLYRVIPGLPAGFAPQVAMAIFGGAVLKDRKWALLLPVLSLFLSDVLFQFLYMSGLSITAGFYPGQWVIYLLFIALTFFGSLMKKKNVIHILGFSIAGSVLFFIFSNLSVWLGGGGFGRPQTFEGLMLCYTDAIAYYRQYGVVNGFAGNFIIGDLCWSAVLFGAWFLIGRMSPVGAHRVVNS